MRLAPLSFRVHRWLSWLIGLQIVIWVTGGLVFSLLPFKGWVKGGDVVRPPVLAMPGTWTERALPMLAAVTASGQVTGVNAVPTVRGAALRVTLRGQPRPVMVLADGGKWTPPDADAARRFALSLYVGSGSVRDVQRIDTVPKRLGLVDESGGRRDVWRVRFDDALGTRLYFDGHSGELLAVRTEAWVWYDLFWRLHIMDYSDGEDFNGTLLRTAAVLAGAMVAAGAVLSLLALRRRVRAQRAVAPR